MIGIIADSRRERNIPAVGISADEYVALLPFAMRQLVKEIRRREQAGERLRPSRSLIDYSALLTREHRNNVLDAIASLVDENYAGCPVQ